MSQDERHNTKEYREPQEPPWNKEVKMTDQGIREDKTANKGCTKGMERKEGGKGKVKKQKQREMEELRDNDPRC